MSKRYICYIKREDRMEEPKHITVTETELIDIIENDKEVQGYRMSQIEMILTKEDTNTICAYSGLPAALNEYNNTMEETNQLQDLDQQLVLMGEEHTPENTLRFYAKQEEVIRLSEGKFYYRGEEVEDKYQVYERFNEWLKMAEQNRLI
jgi:hypothetical protein